MVLVRIEQVLYQEKDDLGIATEGRLTVPGVMDGDGAASWRLLNVLCIVIVLRDGLILDALSDAIDLIAQRQSRHI